MATDHELIDYLIEHVAYEWLMLRFTYERSRTDSELLSNALYESFGLHARALYDFLRNEKDHRNFKASNFVHDFAVNDRRALEGLVPSINQQLIHLGKRRANDADKITRIDVERVYAWIENGMNKFISELPSNFGCAWDATRIDPANFENSLRLSNTATQSSFPTMDSTAMPRSTASMTFKKN